MRIRDELKMNIESYRNLYESVLAYGMRKAMLGQKEKDSRHKEWADQDQDAHRQHH